MRRLIIGAVALVTGLLAAGGVALTRRRRGRDETLPLDPVPPLGDSVATGDASVEADFGAAGRPAQGDEVGEAAPAVAPKRKPRVRRKPVKAAEPESAMSAAAAESAEAEARAEAADTTAEAADTTAEAADTTAEAEAADTTAEAADATADTTAETTALSTPPVEA